MDEVFQIADDITVLRDGSVVSTDRAQDIDLDTVISRMVGRKIEKCLSERAERHRREGSGSRRPDAARSI